MIVSVVFNSTKTYDYLANDYTLKLGDKVVVPVGNFGHLEIGRIVGMVGELYYEGGVSMCEMKHIIEKADRDTIMKMRSGAIKQVERCDKLLAKL